MNKPKARKNNIVVQKLGKETLVYDLNENRALCLNETSAIVWGMCDGRRTATEISDEMSKKLKTLIDEDLVNLALDQLNKDGLLEDGGGNYLEEVSRREVIRKVGFASMVVLPVVSSLVAPEAALAQSCLSGTSSGCGSPCCPGLTCFVGLHCCVPGVSGANAPGFNACQPIGTFTTPSSPELTCCSGTWSLSPPAAPCAAGEERCRCDPLP